MTTRRAFLGAIPAAGAAFAVAGNIASETRHGARAGAAAGAEGLRFTINLATPDNGESFVIELENATLTNMKGFRAEKADLTLTIDRTDLEQTMMGAKTLDAQIADGTAKVEGDVGVLAKLAATMVDFDPRFEIMPGTVAAAEAAPPAEPYEAVPERVIPE